MDTTHARVTELLPWYVNDTLAAAERAELDRHLRDCLVCRTALQEEQRMQKLVQSQEDVPLSADHRIGDLLTRIDASEGRSRRGTAAPRLAFAASLAGVVLVSAIIFFALRAPLEPNVGEFSTLTDAPLTDQNRIDVVFAEGVGADEILLVLEDIGGRVITGPSDLGRYTVALSGDAGFSLEEIIDQLSDDPRIRFAGQNFIVSPTEEQQ